ncbi:hypothetical protein SDRG_00422 [Saprolegnia diclina VS20]|uniref:ABC transmembrane type-1 domain-containing protein n=1 Tax=Saprolegnia diclina (strain VS20) TaxID=1156394 RepID=T0R897_SAPDV|nr:hypothetical protein SDRG_00422 [Saprolegnia diclina VS20]EQC42695.1 hypothetical protein SDRG_00422 [Saprolegnia diclina VS20]|eukprot:XP_008604118.1 hypothetical protein SDRG_00422 [Saprolegnia diclina VS20]
MQTKDVDSYALVTTPKNNEAPPSETPTNTAPMVSFAKLFSFADTTDKVLLALGTLSSMVLGVAQPLQIVFFGNVVNAFNPTSATGADAFRDSINRTVIQFAIMGAVVLVTGATQIACWNIAAARQTKRLRHAYATAILRQEVGWFDVNEPMQLATRVADTTLIIQEGMGRKVADAINFMTMGLTGIVVGFVYGWDLTLVLLALSPFVAGSGYYMVKTIAAATQGGVEAYAEAGGVAEEALSNIRTIHAFNAMPTVVKNYMAALRKTEAAGVKKGLAVGLGTGGMFFVIFCTYALGLYYGAVRVSTDQITDKCVGSGCYDGGRVIILHGARPGRPWCASHLCGPRGGLQCL